VLLAIGFSSSTDLVSMSRLSDLFRYWTPTFNSNFKFKVNKSNIFHFRGI